MESILREAEQRFVFDKIEETFVSDDPFGALELINSEMDRVSRSFSAENVAYARILQGEILYYIAVDAGPEISHEHLRMARNAFEAALKLTKDPAKISSVVSKMTLVAWHLGETELWQKYMRMLVGFSNDTMAMRTRSILCFLTGSNHESLRINSKVFKMAVANENMILAGLTEELTGDVLAKMKKISESKQKYRSSLSILNKLQKETGREVTIHLKRVETKLSNT